MSWFPRALVDERGVSGVVVALILPGVIAMQALTVDVGMMYMASRQAQLSADAAALAAGSYLPASSTALARAATTTAIDFAALNGSAISSSNVLFSTSSQPNDTMQVDVRESRDFFFAPILGVRSGSLVRSATVQVGQAGAVTGAMPWGVTYPSGGFTFAAEYCLKLPATTANSKCAAKKNGNFNVIDVDNAGSSSAAAYRNSVEFGSLYEVKIGDIRSIVTGDMKNAAQQGLNARTGSQYQEFSTVFASLGGNRYQVLDWASKQIVIVPIVTSGTSTVTIHGFGVFFVQEPQKDGSIIGRFVDTIVPNSGWAPLGPLNYGAHSVRLR